MDLPAGCPDEPDLEEAIQGRRREDERLLAPCAWDASDGVRPDAAADAARRFPVLAGGDAGKLAAQVQGGRERDAFRSALQVAQ